MAKKTIGVKGYKRRKPGGKKELRRVHEIGDDSTMNPSKEKPSLGGKYKVAIMAFFTTIFYRYITRS